MTTPLLASSASEWTLGHEGLSPALALLLAVALAAAAVWSYKKFALLASPWLRWTLTVTRALTLTVLVVLLTEPVLHLTLTEPVRQNLLVLLDSSESMMFADKREREDDLKRAAIAAGALAPDRGLGQKLPADAKEKFGEISRWELLAQLAANDRLDLWRKVGEKADITVSVFGRELAPVGALAGPGGVPPTADDAVRLFKRLRADQPATAIGSALQQALGAGSRRPDAVLLVTDGANNSGVAPLSAAQLARNLRVPLFIHGVGVTAPPDVAVLSVTPPKLAFARERATVRAKIYANGFQGKTVTVQLKAGGQVADEQPLTISGDGETEMLLRLEPEDVGEQAIEVTVSTLPGEVSTANNHLTAKLRVTDEKFHVLFIEQEPRWDFRYLLAYLERDRRLEVKCVVIDGEPGLDQFADSPFLPRLPDDRETLFESQVLILGDVNPQDLGEERMELIAEWVEAGGGIIFLAGSRFNPTAYEDTPLAPLLPVAPDLVTARETATQRQLEPFKLALTPAGAVSPYLQMSPDPLENQRVWDEFPGVRWTAPVLRAKPGAEVLLTDSRPERAGRYGPAPVFAMQNYGAGMCVFIGTDETYRWRSHTGEKYYSILWGQIMQTLSLQLLQSASPQTQLKTDRAQYFTGDTVVIAGNAYAAGYKPLLVPSLDGTLTVSVTDGAGKTTEKKRPLSLAPVGDKNTYRAEFTVSEPGEYVFTTPRDDTAALRFTVSDPRLEQANVMLNARALRALADTAGGKFLREENLHELPKLLAEKESAVAVFRKKDLVRSPWWVALLLTLLTTEWLLRRLNQLK